MSEPYLRDIPRSEVISSIEEFSQWLKDLETGPLARQAINLWRAPGGLIDRLNQAESGPEILGTLHEDQRLSGTLSFLSVLGASAKPLLHHHLLAEAYSSEESNGDVRMDYYKAGKAMIGRLRDWGAFGLTDFNHENRQKSPIEAEFERFFDTNYQTPAGEKSKEQHFYSKYMDDPIWIDAHILCGNDETAESLAQTLDGVIRDGLAMSDHLKWIRVKGDSLDLRMTMSLKNYVADYLEERLSPDLKDGIQHAEYYNSASHSYYPLKEQKKPASLILDFATALSIVSNATKNKGLPANLEKLGRSETFNEEARKIRSHHKYNVLVRSALLNIRQILPDIEEERRKRKAQKSGNTP